ncbi:hypothetical protein EDB85DRAFT_1901680 [Lactarius pseudohatsudake]|nr:hypothetical protein EDB85DRAFT_1901680 [Lactarius pseudohatsudake]
MAVAVVGVAVAAAIAATICGSRVADDVGGPLCGQRRATRVFGGLQAGVRVRGGGSVMTVVLHQFEIRGKEKERKKKEDSSKISVEHPLFPFRQTTNRTSPSIPPHLEDSNNDNPMPTTRQATHWQRQHDWESYKVTTMTNDATTDDCGLSVERQPRPRTTKRFVDEDDRDHNRDGGYGDNSGDGRSHRDDKGAKGGDDDGATKAAAATMMETTRSLFIVVNTENWASTCAKNPPLPVQWVRVSLGYGKHNPDPDP